MIRHYHGIKDPSVLTNLEWAKRVNEITFCLEFEGDIVAGKIVKTLAPMFK